MRTTTIVKIGLCAFLLLVLSVGTEIVRIRWLRSRLYKEIPQKIESYSVVDKAEILFGEVGSTVELCVDISFKNGGGRLLLDMVDENLSGDYLVIRRIGDYHPTFINIEKGRGWDPCRPRILNKAMGINIASVLDIIENYEKIYKYIDSCPFYEEAKIAYENNEPLKLVDVDGERYYPVKGLQEN